MTILHQWDHNEHRNVLFTCSRSEEKLLAFLNDDYNFEGCLRLLSLTDQVKVRNVKHNKKHALLSRLFMKIVLNSVLAKLSDGLKPGIWDDIDFEFSEHGKPQLPGLPFAFNNSNSNDLACIAILLDSEAVGIDLSHEEQDSISSTGFMDEFAGIFSDSEATQLQAIEDRDKAYVAFNHLWTLKEAFTKYLGTGLNIDLSSFSFGLASLPTERHLPKEIANPFTLYPINWVESSIDYSKVDHDLLKLKLQLHCYSATLKLSGKLPVIASIISDRPGNAIGIHIDFYEILKKEVA